MPSGPHDARPRVTVITTFRDAEAFLARCIESVGVQSEARFVHRLVDDGSSDASLAIARAAAACDPRLEVVALPAGGRRLALTAAHRDVTTEFVAWVDADDWLEPEALARTLAVMQRAPECGLVFTDHERADHDGKPIAVRPRPLFSRYGMLVDFATFHFRLIRRAAFEAAGGIAEDVEVGIDYDLCLRLCDVASVVHLAEPLHTYRVHRGQMSVTQRRAQIAASAAAVRRAIARRGLEGVVALDVDRRTGRFRLRARGSTAPARWHEHARLAVRTLVSRRGAPPSELRSASVWPTRREDPIGTSIGEGLHRRGLGLVPVASGLAALVRSTWSGRIGDVLVVHAIAAALGDFEPGPRAARRRLLVTALDRARAQGARLAWCAWADAHDPRLDAETALAVSRRCDVVLLERADAIAIAAETPRIVTPPGHVLELQPVMSRAAARARLGLPLDASVCVRLGSITTAKRINALVASFVEHAHAENQLVVRAPPPADDVARSLGAEAIDAANVHWILQRCGPRELACAVAAADLVLVDDGPDAWPIVATAQARGRAVVVPAEAPGLQSDHRYASATELGALLGTLDRAALAAAGRAARTNAASIAPERVAALMLDALQRRG